VAGAFALSAAWVAFAVYNQVDNYHPIPSSVPAGAVEIPTIGKSHGWVACSIESSQTRCRVFNQLGETITDDVFLPFDGGVAPTAADLTIEPFETSYEYVRLQSGRLLLPRTNFLEHKEFAERVLEPPTSP
jgi:hypothetical protein